MAQQNLVYQECKFAYAYLYFKTHFFDLAFSNTDGNLHIKKQEHKSPIKEKNSRTYTIIPKRRGRENKAEALVTQ